MSIYSGFATRFQEETYDNCIDSLLYILQKRLIKFYTNEIADEEKFISLVTKLHHQMRNMQKSKYLQPKNSASINELVKFVAIHQESIICQQVVMVEEKQGLHRPEKSIEPKKHQINQKDNKNVLPVNSNLGKNTGLWVEKQELKQDKEIQTIEIEVDDKSHKKPSGTSYNVGYIANRSRARLPSKALLNKDKKERQRSIDDYKKVPRVQKTKKNHSVANYHQDPISISPRLAYKLDPITIDHYDSKQDPKRKTSRHVKINHNSIQTRSNDHNNEVSDIIKEYIIKSKKQYNRGHKYREYQQGKIYDYE